LFIAHHNLQNVVWFVDRNYLQGFGRTEDTMQLDPLDKKLESFGFQVVIADGHDLNDLSKAFVYALPRVSSDKADELISMFVMCQKSDLVSMMDLFKPELVDKLSDERRTLLAQAIAAEGLADDEGNPNQGLVTALMIMTDDSAPEKIGLYGQVIVDELVNQWMKPEVGASDPNREYLTHFLSLIGYEFEDETAQAQDSPETTTTETIAAETEQIPAVSDETIPPVEETPAVEPNETEVSETVPPVEPVVEELPAEPVEEMETAIIPPVEEEPVSTAEDTLPEEEVPIEEPPVSA